MFQHLFGGKNAEQHEVAVREAQRLQQEGAQLIDVREPSEFAAGHAKGARNIPLNQLANRLSELHSSRPVLVICQSGSRSQTAQKLLQRQKIEHVLNVRGGTGAWRAAGLPIV